jgi:hypothetical protein
MSLKMVLAVPFILIAFAWFVVSPSSAQPAEGDWNKVPLTSLRVGVGKADITPVVGMDLGGYAARDAPSIGVYDPLYVVALLFEEGDTRAAILGFDTLRLSSEDGAAIRKVIKEKTGARDEHILLNASHTHGAVRISTNSEYRDQVLEGVGAAMDEALAGLAPCSLGYGVGEVDFNISRRTLNEEGICRSALNPEGIADHRLKVLRFDQDDSVEPFAVLMHMACHPNAFSSPNLEFSGDFVSVGRTFLEKNFGGKTKGLFLQGCAGDLRPNMPPIGGGDGWRHASEAGMTWCGFTLGAEAIQVSTRLRVHEHLIQRATSFPIRGATRTAWLEPDPAKLTQFPDDFYETLEEGKIPLSLRALSIGDLLFIALPGEPVIEYALRIEEDLAPLGKQVFVLGYSDADTGYIPVEHMIAEGGYETNGPYTSSAESRIRETVAGMARELFPRE